MASEIDFKVAASNGLGGQIKVAALPFSGVNLEELLASDIRASNGLKLLSKLFILCKPLKMHNG